MKYGYAVKKNGILYTPGMDVPGDNTVKVESTGDVKNIQDEASTSDEELEKAEKKAKK